MWDEFLNPDPAIHDEDKEPLENMYLHFAWWRIFILKK